MAVLGSPFSMARIASRTGGDTEQFSDPGPDAEGEALRQVADVAGAGHGPGGRLEFPGDQLEQG